MSNMMLVKNVKIEQIEVIYEYFFLDEGVVEGTQIEEYTLAVADFAARHPNVMRCNFHYEDEPEGTFVILTNKFVTKDQVKQIGNSIVDKLTQAAFA